MTTALILILLGSALLHAVWNAIIKGGSDKLFETVMKTGSGGLAGLICLVFLPLPAPASWPYLAATCALHLFYYLLLAHAYRGSDLSYAYTLMRGASPLFTALVAVFFLGDPLSAGGWAGVILLSLGILSLTCDSARCGGFNGAVTLMALANALVIMGYTVVDGSGVRLSGNAVAYVCWVFFLNSFPILLYALVRRGGAAYLGYVRRRWKYGLAGGLCSVVAYGLSVWAMAHAPIALVAALREISVLFGMLLAVLFLREKLSLPRLCAVALVVGGAVSIKVFA